MEGLYLVVTTGGKQRRVELASGRTRIGSGDCELQIPAPPGEELHFWTNPPKLLFVGRGEEPQREGVRFRELALLPGAHFRWLDHHFAFGARSSVLVEEPTAATDTAPASAPALDERAWRRIKAGLLVELGLADKQVARRQQAAIAGGEYEPDQAADLLLAGAPPLLPPAVMERSARLARDLIMAPAQTGLRGAGRRLRRKVRGGLAMALSQVIAILGYSLLLLCFGLIARARYGHSLDAALDRIVQLLPFAE